MRGVSACPLEVFCTLSLPNAEGIGLVLVALLRRGAGVAQNRECVSPLPPSGEKRAHISPYFLCVGLTHRQPSLLLIMERVQHMVWNSFFTSTGRFLEAVTDSFFQAMAFYLGKQPVGIFSTAEFCLALKGGGSRFSLVFFFSSLGWCHFTLCTLYHPVHSHSSSFLETLPLDRHLIL